MMNSAAGDSLAAISERLAIPKDFYGGVGDANLQELPRNILCFTRRQGRELEGMRIRSHHHRHVLVVPLAGTGFVCRDDQRLFLAEGQAQIIFPFQFHAYLNVRPRRILWLFVTFELAAPGPLEALSRSRAVTLGAFETELLRQVVLAAQRRSSAHVLQLQLATLLARLPALTARRPPGRPPVFADETGIKLLTRINGLVRDHLEKHRAISVKEIAAKMGVSESHLRMIFRTATRSSLGRHLRELRLRRAAGLLQSRALSVTEVAQRCGFASVYSFSRAFKAEWGQSPRAYRTSRAV